MLLRQPKLPADTPDTVFEHQTLVVIHDLVTVPDWHNPFTVKRYGLDEALDASFGVLG